MHSFLLALLLAADLTPQQQAAMDHISAQSLRGHLSFIASDLLEGRATPSPGLNLAAEYIAAQFRRAGLEPVGDDGYFQNAAYQSVKPDPERVEFSLDTARADPGTVVIQEAVATDLSRAAAFKVTLSDIAALDALTTEEVH